MWYTTRQGTGIEIKTAITITFVHHSLVNVSLVIIYNVNVCFIGGSIVLFYWREYSPIDVQFSAHDAILQGNDIGLFHNKLNVV